MLQEETLARKFVRKWFWLYLFTFLIAPLGYIVKMVISRDLSVEDVGVIYGVISFVTLIGVYNDLWFTESLNFFLPKYIVNKEIGKAKYLLKLAFFAQGISSVIIAAFLFFLAPWIAEHYFHHEAVSTVLRIAGLFFIGINILHISTTLFTVTQDVKFQKMTEFIRMASTAIGTIILFLSDTGNTENYMWIWVSGVFLSMIFAFFFAYHRHYRDNFLSIESSLTRAERNEFIRYAGATLLTANIATILSQIDMQLIIFLLGAAATGYYSNYLSLMNIPFIFIAPIIGFLFPVISELYGRSDKLKMRLIHERFSLYFSIIGVWISFFLLQFGEELAVTFFGNAFELSGYILMFSAPFIIFNLMNQVNFQILAGTGQIGTRARILAIAIPINLVLNLVFIHTHMISWAALAVGLSWIPLWYMSHRATREYHGNFSLPTFFKNIILAASTYGTLHLFFLSFSIPSNLVVLCIAVLLNLIIFSAWNKLLLREMWETIQKNRK
jgi:stage V sporulation protein B